MVGSPDCGDCWRATVQHPEHARPVQYFSLFWDDGWWDHLTAETVGATVQHPEHARPVQYFSLFWDDGWWDHLTAETVGATVQHPEHARPVQFFSLFWDDGWWDHLTAETVGELLFNTLNMLDQFNTFLSSGMMDGGIT